MLVEMARAMTASQLMRTIAGFRAVDGSRLGQDAVRRAEWFVREDGMVEIRAVLPAEIGAELVTALELAMDRDGSAPPALEREPSSRAPSDGIEEKPGSADDHSADERAAEITTTATLEQRRADAMHSLARTYLAAEPDDRSGEDRHLVIVQVSAEALAQNVPAGTPRSADHGVPAGTPPRCGVLGAGPLEVTTAERLACTGQVSLMLTDAGGEVLHLGRKQRLASRAQRRALRLRDTTCTFPGCHQTRHLDAHHLVPWSQGGLTDIDGLALLCRRHHVMVHEGGMRVVHDPYRSSPHERRLQVLDSIGRPVQARWPAMLEHLRVRGQAGEAPATRKHTRSAPSRLSAGADRRGRRRCRIQPRRLRRCPLPERDRPRGQLGRESRGGVTTDDARAPSEGSPGVVEGSRQARQPAAVRSYLLKPAVRPLISWRRPAM